MGATLEIDFRFPDWAKKLESRMTEVNLFLAAQIQFNRGMLFDKEGAHNGRPRWKELVLRRGQILTQRGVLRKSIAPLNPKGKPGPDGIVTFQGDEITVGTKLGYARMMNDGTTKMPGGKLMAKDGKALRIPLPAGKNATEASKDLAKRSQSQRRNYKALEVAERRLRRARKPAVRARIQARIDKIKERIAASRERGDSMTQRYIFRKSVRIPARPFDDWNAEDQKELDEALMAKIVQILNE